MTVLQLALIAAGLIGVAIALQWRPGRKRTRNRKSSEIGADTGSGNAHRRDCERSAGHESGPPESKGSGGFFAGWFGGDGGSGDGGGGGGGDGGGAGG